jgi:hypothetical protein
VPRYLLVRESEVEPDVLEMAREVVRRALPELNLGATPEIRWFADVRELSPGRVASARAVYVPEDGLPTAGSVPPDVRYSPETGWQPPAPVILLNRSRCQRDTPLHELRHLWQIKAGLYHANETASRMLEDEADAWTADALVRLGIETRSAARSEPES